MANPKVFISIVGLPKPRMRKQKALRLAAFQEHSRNGGGLFWVGVGPRR